MIKDNREEQLLIRIQQNMDDEPFSSTRSIANTLNENNMIIYRYMTIYLKKVFRLSRWVPHSLDQRQIRNRVEQTKALSDILKKYRHDSFNSIITGDQKWFNLYCGNNGAWIESGQNPPEMNGDQITIKKVMVTIIWGFYGFYVIDFLPCEESYNSQYHIDNFLIPLAEIKSEIWKQSDKRKI